MLKKVLSIVLSALICAAMCVCGVAEESTQVTLYYPSYLQESEGEALVLDQMPERIVCLSNAALQILVRCGIQPVAVTEPTTSVPISSAALRTISCSPSILRALRMMPHSRA